MVYIYRLEPLLHKACYSYISNDNLCKELHTWKLFDNISWCWNCRGVLVCMSTLILKRQLVRTISDLLIVIISSIFHKLSDTCRRFNFLRSRTRTLKRFLRLIVGTPHELSLSNKTILPSSLVLQLYDISLSICKMFFMNRF